MRILLTIHQYFPDFAAGTEVLTRAVAREMTRRGHEVRILTGYAVLRGMRDADRCDEYIWEGLRVYRFHHAYEPMGDQDSMLAVGFDNHLAAAFFSRILDDFKPDVVHFFHFNRLGTGMVDVAVSAGCPAFFTPTDFWAVCPTAQLLYCKRRQCGGPTALAGNCVLHFGWNALRGPAGELVGSLPSWCGDILVRVASRGWFSGHWVAREIKVMGGRLATNVRRLNRLNGILAPNRVMADTLCHYGVRRELITVSPFGIELDPALQGVDRESRGGGPLRIGFIGSLQEHKGCHILLEAFSHLERNVAELTIYGALDEDSSYAALLRGLAAGTDNVTFRGTFDNERIAQVLSEIDVLVVPSIWSENTPLVVYAAQASRCPVIVSDVPGLSSMVEDGKDGLLFRPGDAVSLADRFKQLLQDRALLRQMGSLAPLPKNVSVYCDELMQMWSGGCSGSRSLSPR